MSHGRIINLDTPHEIKRKFGVGYSIYVEARHEYENMLDKEGLKSVFDRVRQIFFGNDDLSEITESPDSNDKKLIIHVPTAYVQEMAGLIKRVEDTV